MHLYGDLSASFEASNLDEGHDENDNRQYHGVFDIETSAKLEIDSMTTLIAS